MFKNMSVLTLFQSLCFLGSVADVKGTWWFIFTTTLLVPNVIEASPNVYQSLGVPQ